MGHLLGRCLAEISCRAEPEQGYRGYCTFHPFVEEMYGFPQWMQGSHNPERITILYAGTIALSMLCQQQGWNYERWRGCDRADFDAIALLSLEIVPGEDEDDNRIQMQQMCQKQARELLEQYRQAVEALAQVLLKQGHISGGKAHRIIQQNIDQTYSDWRMEL